MLINRKKRNSNRGKFPLKNMKYTLNRLKEVGINDYNGILEILKMLDFKEIIVVKKIRNSIEYNDIIFSIPLGILVFLLNYNLK